MIRFSLSDKAPMPIEKEILVKRVKVGQVLNIIM